MISDERMEELIDGFKAWVLMGADYETKKASLERFAKAIAAEARKDGIDEMLEVAKRLDPWKTGLDKEAERLKEQG